MKNGYHEFMEIMKDGEKWIVDNLNPNGIPYNDFIKNLEVVDPSSGLVKTGEEAYKLATKK